MKLVNSTALILGVLGTLLSVPRAHAAPTEVAACGLSLPEDGILTTDLDCSSVAGDALTISSGTLELNGHTLVGQIRCTGSCSLIGPGSLYAPVVNPSQISWAVLGFANVELASVFVRGPVYAGKKLTIESGDLDALASHPYVEGRDGLTVTGATVSGTLRSDGAISVSNSDVHGTLLGDRAKVRDSTITGFIDCERSAVVSNSTINGGVRAHWIWEAPRRNGCNGDRGKVRIYNSTISIAEGTAVHGGQKVGILGSQILISGGGYGVFTVGWTNDCDTTGHYVGSATIIDSTIDGGTFGVYAAFVQMAASAVTGWNTTGIHSQTLQAQDLVVVPGLPGPECGVTVECSDIATASKPVGSIDCSTSRHLVAYDPEAIHGDYWGVCGGN